jgi:glycerol-3-phosphate acyltransferase PlsX
VRHSEVSIAMDDKPSQALRRGRGKSSLWMAIDAVRSGDAQVALSAGNTGAMMAMATVILRTMPGIKRPAIAAIWPTLKGESVVLDVGATIGVDAEQLVNFAVMGEAMARCLFLIDRPTVGLLNIGVEEVKGNEVVRDAGRILRQAKLPIEYYGFVEGDDMGKGTVDVVVTEGFIGNIALKTAEGTAKQLMTYLRSAMKRTFRSRLGAVLAQGAFAALRSKMDPRRHNGGVFLGLNGIVVKSHGATDDFGFAAAADLAIEMARNSVIEKIAADLAALDAGLQAVSEEPVEEQT